MADVNGAFWNSHLVEPKRKFKFYLLIPGIPAFLVKSISRPKQTISQIEIPWLNHTFKYTGRNKWDDITIEFIDSEQANTLKILLDKIEQSGYMLPKTPEALNTISKRGAVEALQSIYIQQLTYDGRKMEEWKLQNAWISSVDPGQGDYGTDEAFTVSATIVFDWAELTVFDPPV